ncbi:hypothetical protein [Verrucomicrobium sp. BvORR106]|uniref:hypothetical protein n=1 Tax=Verrucomicrobium sp. BvORR106 TaxID=1403819 RepID=UPI00056FB8E1|nr:hypothetical protein [Verrucomicrobium sp. BvORR106]
MKQPGQKWTLQTSCICMNLPRRQDRRFVLLQTAPDDVAKTIQFIHAADGECVSEMKCRRWNIGKRSYAVGLSKRIAIRRFLQSDDDALLLLEDDVMFTKDFTSKIDFLIDNLPDGWGMFFLGGNHVRPPLETDSPGLVRCVKTHFNHALMIRRWCASRILKELGKKPFRQMFSDQTVGKLQSEIPTYAPERWIALQRHFSSDNIGGMRGRRTWSHTQGSDLIHDDEATAILCVVKPTSRILIMGSPGVCEYLTAVFKSSSRHASQSIRLVSDARLPVLEPNTVDVCIVSNTTTPDPLKHLRTAITHGGWLFVHGTTDQPSRNEDLETELLDQFRVACKVTHTSKGMTVFQRKPSQN